VKGGEEIRDARKSDDKRKQWSTREREREMKFWVFPQGESEEGDASGSSTFIFESPRPPLHTTSEPLKAQDSYLVWKEWRHVDDGDRRKSSLL